MREFCIAGEKRVTLIFLFLNIIIFANLIISFDLQAEEPPKERWVSRYNSASNNFDIPTAITVDKEGNVYVTGYRDDGNNDDYATVKYDVNGNQLWAAQYNGTANGNDQATGLVVDNFGNIYVTGYSKNENANSDYATVKYNADGNQLWEFRNSGDTILNSLDLIRDSAAKRSPRRGSPIVS